MEQWSNGAIQREYGVCCRLRDQMMERREFQPENLQVPGRSPGFRGERSEPRNSHEGIYKHHCAAPGPVSYTHLTLPTILLV